MEWMSGWELVVVGLAAVAAGAGNALAGGGTLITFPMLTAGLLARQSAAARRAIALDASQSE